MSSKWIGGGEKSILGKGQFILGKLLLDLYFIRKPFSFIMDNSEMKISGEGKLRADNKIGGIDWHPNLVPPLSNGCTSY